MSLRTQARGALTRAYVGAPARLVNGVLERLAGAPSGAFAALTYHRVDDAAARPWLFPGLLSATPESFERQMRDLRAYARPISMEELLSAHRGHRALPRRAVLVTFDDAYRDFRDQAWPILERLGIPATLFVPTAYCDPPGRAFWWDRLWEAVSASSADAIAGPFGSLALPPRGHRLPVTRWLIDAHKRLPHEEAMRSVDDLCRQLGAPEARSDVLDWEDLRRLSDRGVALAPHTRTHPILTRVGPDVLSAEIEGSRSDLDRNLPGSQLRVFAYPSGVYDARATNALSRHGFELAFTTRRTTNRLGATNALELGRLNVGVRTTSSLIRGQLAVGTAARRISERVS